MRSRAAELRHHAGDPRQDVAERRARHLGHQNVAGRDTRELAFAAHHHGAPRAPADASRMTIEAGMHEPDLVGYMRGLHMQRPRLQEPEALIVEGPFDLDRHAHQRLGRTDEAPERHRLPGIKTRLARKLLRHRLRRRAHMSTGLAVVLATGFDRAHEASPAQHNAVVTTSPCAMAEPSPHVALISIWPSAVSLKPLPDA